MSREQTGKSSDQPWQGTNGSYVENKGVAAKEADAEDTMPMGFLQKRRHEAMLVPTELIFRNQINGLTQKEIVAIRSLNYAQGRCQKMEFVAPSAAHIIRCPISSCRNPISSHGIERSVKSHL